MVAEKSGAANNHLSLMHGVLGYALRFHFVHSAECSAAVGGIGCEIVGAIRQWGKLWFMYTHTQPLSD